MKRVDIFCRKLFFICRTIGIDVSISKEVNASEVRTLWRYTNVFIIMLLLLVTKFVEYCDSNRPTGKVTNVRQISKVRHTKYNKKQITHNALKSLNTLKQLDVLCQERHLVGAGGVYGPQRL